MAKVYFNQVYKGTGSSYTISSNSIAITSAVNGSSFSFTSSNPSDPTFIASGNNVAGTLSYVDGSGSVVSISGVISRQEKAGSNTRAYYFVADGTGEAYLMPEPADQGIFTGNQSVSTDSSPFLDALNDFLNTQAAQPSISVASTAASYSEAAGFAVFTVSLSSAAASNVTFTPTLNSGTATVGTDTGAALEKSTDGGVTWTAVVGAVTISAGATSIRLRVAITDDVAPEASESFTLTTGAVTGGNVVNNGGAFSSTTITDNDSVDNTPPAAPVVTNVTELATDPNANDLLSNDNTQVLTVTGEAGCTLRVYTAAGVLVPTGNYSVTETSPGVYSVNFGSSVLADGQYAVRLTDAANNESTSSAPFTIDTTPPAAPTVTAQTTNDTTPVITGTATVAAGETLTVSVNGVTYTAGDGRLTLTGTAWSLQIPDAAALAAGTYPVTATVTDSAGNAASDSTTSELTIDRTVTSGPLDMTNATDSGSSPEDELTSNGLPVLTFTGEPGLTLNLRGPDGTALTAGTHYSVAYSGGTYTVTLLDAQPGGAANPFGTYNAGAPTANPAATADGVYTLNATDPYGNTGTVGTFTIDTTPPAAPTVTAQTTNDTTPVITGTATVAAGETLTVSVNGVTYTAGDGSLVLNGTTWSLQIPDDRALPETVYAVTATIVDAAGNSASDPTTGELAIDRTLTVGPLDMTNATDSGSSPEDELTSNGLPVLTFTGEPGLTLNLRGPDGTALTAGTHYSVAYSGGTYTVTLLDAQPGGAANPFGTYNAGAPTANPAATADGVYTLNATDPSGNSGPVGTFTIDTTPPARPTVVSQTTADTTPAITGTAQLAEGDTLSVTLNGVTYRVGDGRLTLNGSTWSLQVPDDAPLQAGSYSVTATITDKAGNTAVDATSSELTIEQTVTRLTAQDAGGNAADPSDSVVTEGAPLRFAVELNAPSRVATTMPLSLGGTATSADLGSLRFSDGVTYDAATGLITIPPGVSTFSIEVPTVDDPLVEPTESLTLNLARVTATGTVTDNDSQSVTRVTAEDALNPNAADGDASVVEGQTLSYSVTLSAPSATASRLSLDLSGSAAAADLGALTFSDGVQRDATTGELIVPPGVTSFRILVPTVDDPLVEPAETATVTVGGVPGVGTIVDNDRPTISSVRAQDPSNPLATHPDQQVPEGSPLEFVVTLSQASAAAATFPLNLGGTAASVDLGRLTFSDGVTFDAATGLITIPAGITGFRVTVPTIDDTQVEVTESVLLQVGGISAVGTIADNDRLSVSRITPQDANNAGGSAAPDASVEEGGTLRFGIALSGSSPLPTTFALSLTGTAAPADLGALRFTDGVTFDPLTGEVTVPAGVSSFSVDVATRDDSMVESAESVRLNLGGLSSTGLITDNDSPAISSITANDAGTTGWPQQDSAVVEGQTLRFAVALQQAASRPVTFSLGLSGSALPSDLGAMSFSDGVTLDAATGLLTIPAGVASFQITLPTTDDTSVEATEDVRLSIGGLSAAGIITDNDQPSITQVVAEDNANQNAPGGDAAVIEGQTLRFAVQLSSSSPTAFSVPLSLNGTAVSGDLASLSFTNGVTLDAATGRLLIPAGVSSFALMVPTVDDPLVEFTETVELNLGGVSAVGTISDNDAPSITRVVAEDSANAGAESPDNCAVEGNNLRFSVALSTATIRETRFPIALSGTSSPGDLGTLAFTDGVKYDRATGELVVPAGISSFSMILSTVDDSLVEGPETVHLNLGGISATGTILDNDSLSVAAVTARDPKATADVVSDPSVVEGQGLRFDIALNQAPMAATRIPFSWSGTAAAEDIGALTFSDGVTLDAASGLLNIPAGISRFSITVATVDDRSVEPTERVTLQVGGVLASGTIVDNDRPSVINVAARDGGSGASSIADTTVEEGQPLRYTITLDATTTATIQFPFGLSGTAVQADHAAPTFSNGVTYDPATGLLTVPAGVAQFDILVPTIDDTRSEATESLMINVDGLHAAGRITDNDRPLIQNARAPAGVATAWIKIAENNMPVTVMSTPDPADWVISGGADAAMFTLKPDGNLVFNKAPDYEAPGDAARRNTYQIEVTATDINGNRSRQMITVEVTDVVEAVPLYAARTPEGDRWLSTSLSLTQDRARTQGSNVDIDFYVMPTQVAGTVPLKAWVNLITGDMFYAPEGTAAPYACYVPSDSTQLGFVRPVGKGDIAVHLWMNPQGTTQMATAALAGKLGLAGQGYVDLGAIFASIDPNVVPTAETPDPAVSLIGIEPPPGP